MLRRLLFIVLGYALAAISSGFVVALLLQLIPDYRATVPHPPASPEFLANFALLSAMIALFAAPPAILTIMLGEWKTIRRKRYYGLAGTLIGLGLSLLFYMQNWFPYVGAGYGGVAGLTYWRIAGQNAGALTKERNQLILMAVLAALFLVSFYMTYLDILTPGIRRLL